MSLGAEVAGPGRGGVVVLRLMVASSVEHGAGTVTAAPDFHADVLLGDQSGIESEIKSVTDIDIVRVMNNSTEIPAFRNLPCGGEGISVSVDKILLEDITGLLSDALTQVLVVDLDTGHVTGVARDHSRLPFSGDLVKELHRGTVMIDSKADQTYLSSGIAHIVVAGPVEVLVSPLGESVLTKLGSGTVVLERELGVGLEELRLLHSVSPFNLQLIVLTPSNQLKPSEYWPTGFWGCRGWGFRVACRMRYMKV